MFPSGFYCIQKFIFAPAAGDVSSAWNVTKTVETDWFIYLVWAWIIKEGLSWRQANTLYDPSNKNCLVSNIHLTYTLIYGADIFCWASAMGISC